MQVQSEIERLSNEPGEEGVPKVVAGCACLGGMSGERSFCLG
jgi:hypothetical protein